MFNSQRFTNPSQEKRFFDSGEVQQSNKGRQKLRVYFIGYKLLDAKGNSPRFPVKQTVFQMPPIGEYIEMDAVYYEDLRKRSQMWNPHQNKFIDSITLDADVAQAVKLAWSSGSINPNDDITSFTKVVQSAAIVSMTDAELEAELARRKASVEEPVIDQVVDEPEAEITSTRGSRTTKK